MGGVVGAVTAVAVAAVVAAAAVPCSRAGGVVLVAVSSAVAGWRHAHRSEWPCCVVVWQFVVASVACSSSLCVFV